MTDVKLDRKGIWHVADDADDTNQLRGEALARESLDSRIARGRELRVAVPREAHAVWQPPPNRRSPVEILAEDDSDRQQDLVPLRYGRMSASPFTFYRGAAAIMSADLESAPTTGLQVRWNPVKEAAAFILVIEDEKAHREIKANLVSSATTFTVPEGFLASGTEYKVAIGTVARDGNRSFTETAFTTTEKK